MSMFNGISIHVSKRKIKAAISMLVLCVLTTGCVQKPSYNIDSADDTVQEYSEWKYDGSDYAEPKEKSEMVTVHADATGTVKSIEDAVTLKGISELATDGNQKNVVRDKSNLKDISNKNGDEAFEIKDGHIYFQNLGSDIHYEGKGDVELPVSVNIKYYLDGEEMSPDKIKGKKGHVKVEYSFENSETCEVEICGVTRSVYVPFAAVSMVTPEAGSYSNLKTKNCKTSRLDSEDVIMALCMPGMKKNLEYISSDSLDDDIHESFSFEFDTESFSMGFSTTVISNNFFDENIDLNELNEIKDALSELESAGKKLADGSDTIGAGLCDFEEYLTQYIEGVYGIDSGVNDLAKGIAALNKGKSDIYDGAKGISDSLIEYKAAYDEIKPVLDAMIEADPENPNLQALLQWYEAMAEQNTLLAEGSETYAAGVEEYNKGIASAHEGAKKLKKGSNNLASGGSELSEGYDSLQEGFCEYSNGISKFYSEGIAELEKEGTSKIDEIQDFVRMIEKADKGYKTYSGLEKDQDGSVSIIIEVEEIKD